MGALFGAGTVHLTLGLHFKHNTQAPAEGTGLQTEEAAGPARRESAPLPSAKQLWQQMARLGSRMHGSEAGLVGAVQVASAQGHSGGGGSGGEIGGGSSVHVAADDGLGSSGTGSGQEGATPAEWRAQQGQRDASLPVFVSSTMADSTEMMGRGVKPLDANPSAASSRSIPQRKSFLARAGALAHGLGAQMHVALQALLPSRSKGNPTV